MEPENSALSWTAGHCYWRSGLQCRCQGQSVSEYAEGSSSKVPESWMKYLAAPQVAIQVPVADVQRPFGRL